MKLQTVCRNTRVNHPKILDFNNTWFYCMMIRFEKVSAPYKPIILKWFKEPHVLEFFYGDGLQNTLNNLDLYCQGINHNGRYEFNDWIAFNEDVPFGFLITSIVEGPFDPEDDYNKWYVDGKKTCTLDLLIGEKDFLGKGLAHVMIQQFIRDHYSDADYFIIDPEATNTKAIHVYEKVGFKKVGELCPAFNPKPHIMMRLIVDELRKTL